MTYPEIDAAVIEAARENRAKRYASAEQTKTTIKNLEAVSQTCSDERARQIALAAAGEEVPADATAETENATRRNEESLRRQREILALQTSNIQAAEKEFRSAPGQAHRPRVIFAIRELHDSGHAIAAARSTLAGAEQRDAKARKILNEAFVAGFPAPPRLRELSYQIPAATNKATLRATWGDLAAEALSEPAAA